MATHSSVLAWRIPGTGEPGGLLSRTRLKQLSSSSSKLFFYSSHHSLQTTLNKVLNSDMQRALWKKRRETITEVISVADNLHLQKARLYRQFS